MSVENDIRKLEGYLIEHKIALEFAGFEMRNDYYLGKIEVVIEDIKEKLGLPIPAPVSSVILNQK